MKNSEYRLSRLKHMLEEKKKSGKLYVTWKLNNEQLEFAQNIGYNVVPYLYEIHTRPMQILSGKLVKEIHYAAMRGQKSIVRTLNKSEDQFLSKVGVKHRVLKYKIYL